MLRSLKALEGYTLAASDGDIGSVADFLLDDERWTIRYLVASTGGFLSRRYSLISPMAFREADWASRRFHLAMTREKVESSPSIDTDKPVSRQHEQEYSRYYAYPPYWGYVGLWGMAAYPMALASQEWKEPAVEPSDPPSGDVHLRSAKEVRGYHIQGSDDSIGHVEDYVVDDETWAIRYLVIDTRNWWFGKKVLVAPQWASLVSWDERKVYIDLSRRSIEQSPEWDPSAGVNRAYETRLHEHYQRPAYWEETPPALPKPASDPGKTPAAF